MVVRRHEWNEKTKKWEQTSGPPPDGWKTELFNCPFCGTEFQMVVPIGCKTTDSPCCDEKANLIFGAPQILEKKKWRETGKDTLNSGIPFGEVPGDDDYKEIGNPLGPKP